MDGLSSPLSPFPLSKALSKDRLKTPSQDPLTQPQSPSLSDESNESIGHVPGEPGTDLTRASVCDFLTSELNTPVLDQLYNHLWCVARKSGKSIDPINRQRTKAREIIATEDASLHLVWHRDRIYIKPMPLCLLNHDFWTTFLASPPRPLEPGFDRKIALGFMRSYALLVRHHLDFVLARDAHLFPAQFEWAEWSEFIAHFRRLEDEDVAPRYHYGQLRLSRLNWAVRLFRPSIAQTKWFYMIPYWSTAVDAIQTRLRTYEQHLLSHTNTEKGSRESIIITSQDWQASRLARYCGEIQVGYIEPREARSLLLAHRKLEMELAPKGIFQDCDEIARHLGYLGLAIDLAGAYAGNDEDPRQVLRRYLTDYEKHRDDLLQSEQFRGLSASNKTVWGTTSKKLKKNHARFLPTALLACLARFKGSNIQDELFRLASLGLARVDRELGDEELRFPSAFRRFLTLSGMCWDNFFYRQSFDLLVRYSPVQGMKVISFADIA
ncbi:kinesin light chain [Stemphylium lycopersici]|uniref:Kinesin light chain n=1 Tax=Stemphylium lycopersici TaxID=183478 RepID=A0A364MUU4_STELY|nr:kinesin light chain [Stemphylium lycopersici]RAR03780.1 kinesin light chain [Stemphylium lycopersici]